MSTSNKGAKLEDQIAKLETLAGPDGMVQAREMATATPVIVKLAFKYIDRPYRKTGGLNKSAQATYDALKAVSVQAADDWKATYLADKTAKAESKPATAKTGKGKKTQPVA
jgi:hypothetical protein